MTLTPSEYVGLGMAIGACCVPLAVVWATKAAEAKARRMLVTIEARAREAGVIEAPRAMWTVPNPDERRGMRDEALQVLRRASDPRPPEPPAFEQLAIPFPVQDIVSLHGGVVVEDDLAEARKRRQKENEERHARRVSAEIPAGADDQGQNQQNYGADGNGGW